MTKPEPSAPTCPTCGAFAASGGGGISTAMVAYSFYDEDGRHHVHDDNSHTSFFNCRNGHNFRMTSDNACWCGWKRGSTA